MGVADGLEFPPSAASTSGLSFLCWRCANGLVLLLHLGFEGLASFLPGLLFQRNLTGTETFAGVLSGMRTTAPLALASIAGVTSVGFGGRALPLPSTTVVAAFSLALAGVDAPTSVGVAQNIRRTILRLILVLCMGQHRGPEH